MKKLVTICLLIVTVFTVNAQSKLKSKSFKSYSDVGTLIGMSNSSAINFLIKYNYEEDDQDEIKGFIITELYQDDEKYSNTKGNCKIFTKNDKVEVFEFKIRETDEIGPNNQDDSSEVNQYELKKAFDQAKIKYIDFEKSLYANGFKLSKKIMEDKVEAKYFLNTINKQKAKVFYSKELGVYYIIIYNENNDLSCLE